MNVTSDDIKQLGTILGIWAHPDDESWCAAGVLAAAVANGQRAVCVTATRGDAGVTSDEARWPQAKLAEIREHELEASLDVLGVTEHRWLDYKDGTLHQADKQEAMRTVADIISEIRPDTILTFGPDGLTGHLDHIAVYEWAKTALAETKHSAALYTVVELAEVYASPITKACDERFNIFFNIEHPQTVATDEADLLLELTPELKSKKLRSLAAHECQMDRLFNHPAGKAFIDMLASQEAFMKEPR